MRDATEIVCLIDRSGSMGGICGDAEGGFNQFLKEQKEAPGEANITIAQFDDEYELVADGIDIKKCEEYKLVPRGMTALLDALGKTINTVGERLSKMKDDDRPDKVVLVVVTDGHENASVEFDRKKISEMIKHQEAKYGWKFVFLAANQDAIAEGSSMGFCEANSSNYAATGQGTRKAYAVASMGMQSFRASGDEKDLAMPDNVED